MSRLERDTSIKEKSKYDLEYSDNLKVLVAAHNLSAMNLLILEEFVDNPHFDVASYFRPDQYMNLIDKKLACWGDARNVDKRIVYKTLILSPSGWEIVSEIRKSIVSEKGGYVQ